MRVLSTSVQISCSAVSISLRSHGLQHTRCLCLSPPPGACSNSCPSSWWWHPTILPFVVPFSSYLQSFPESGSFSMSQFFASGGQSIGVSASVSVFQWIFRTDFFKIDWSDLLAVQETLKSLLQYHRSKALILQCSAFFIVELSHPYMTTGALGFHCFSLYNNSCMENPMDGGAW